jgi:integrase
VARRFKTAARDLKPNADDEIGRKLYVLYRQSSLVDRLGKETNRERFLSADEIRIAWAAFQKLGYPWGSLFKMLLVTGQRRGEVAGMRWSEISVPELGELVFRSRTDIPLAGWSKTAKRLQALHGPMPPWHLHDLRQTFATHLRTLGIDRLVVSKLLNHAEGGVTKTYDRWAADPEKADAMERWANRLREIIGDA